MQEPTSRTVVVVPNWLGDAVMALPALAAVRRHRPSDTLIVAGRASTVPLFAMVPDVDEVLRLDSRGGLVGAISWAEDAAVLRSTGAGLAILLPNSFRSAWTAKRAGIPERWGYATDARGRLLTARVPRLRGRFHQAEYYLHLVNCLLDGPGAPRPASPALPRLPRLRPPADAIARADAVLAERGLAPGTPLVGLAPGAAYGKAKQWPPDCYARLAMDLHRRLGAVSLAFGAGADAEVSAAIVRFVAAASAGGREAPGSTAPVVVDLAGRTDLPLLVALMARCRAFVANDSGAMHVAAAAGLPLAAIFGASDERGTAPLTCDVAEAAAHAILTCHVWCRPCMLRECPIDHRCMRGVEPSRVADAVTRLATF